MKRSILYILLPLSLLAACATPVHIEKDAAVDFTKYHNYTWVDTHENEKDSAGRAVAYADISVHNAVNEALQKAGWREVNSNANADVFISYDLLVKRTRQQVSDPVYTQPYSRMYYNPYRRGWSSIYYPSQFLGYENYTVPVKDGTLTISITDAQTDKIVWQGWTTERLNYSRPTGSEISRSVKNIFRKFKP